MSTPTEPTPTLPAVPAGGAPAAPAALGGAPPPAGSPAPKAGEQQPPAGLAPVGGQAQGLPAVAGAGGKPEGNAPSAPSADLKLPEGAPDHWASIAKEAGNDPSKFLAGLLAHSKREEDEFPAKWAELEKGWAQQLAKDPDYGKDVKASDEAVNRGLAKHDPTGRFAAWVQKQGYALAPELRLFLRSVGLGVPQNDSVAGRTGAAIPSAGPKSEEQLLVDAFDHPSSVKLREQQQRRNGA